MDEKKIPWKSEWKAAGLDPGPMTEEELKLVPGLEAENRAFLEKHPFAGKKTAPKSRSLKLQTLFLPLAAAAALLVVFTLPQFAGTGVGLDQERRANLSVAVLGRVGVKHELAERPLQPGERTLQHHEARVLKKNGDVHTPDRLTEPAGERKPAA